MKDDEIVKVIVTDPEMQQRIAKYIALKCFRNTVLEELHSGKVLDSKTGDYSDVVVHTPYGQIPWNALSRFNDDENGELPLLVIDGREISCHDLGRMLIAAEGFQFKLTIGELSDEL